jgi:hypothetical protein
MWLNGLDLEAAVSMCMPQRARMVAAPKRSNGPEQCNDVVDWNGSQFFQQS